MNYYFLLEDERSFIKVLPEWLKYMNFENERVIDIQNMTENCYVMQSGRGLTQLITRVLFQTIDTIIDNPGKIDVLIVILDSEEKEVEERKEQVSEKIKNYIESKQFKLEYKIFVCNHCFESWLLGNGMLYPENPPDEENSFYKHYNNYNIKENDPEFMKPPMGVNETIASYHFHYLHDMCQYNKIRYTKKKPYIAATKEYFEQLVSRIYNTPHLKSFKEFYDYFSSEQS